jgi:agmatine/peptidylarginine deiminase
MNDTHIGVLTLINSVLTYEHKHKQQISVTISYIIADLHVIYVDATALIQLGHSWRCMTPGQQSGI